MSRLKNRIALLLCLAFFWTACSSEVDPSIAESNASEDVSLRLDLTTDEHLLSPDKLNQPLHIRLFLVEENGLVHTNQVYTDKDLRRKTQPILLENLAKGTYALYVLVNEAALGLDELAEVKSQQEIEALQLSSHTLDLTKGIPLAGVNRAVHIEQAHQTVHLSLKRLFAQLELHISHTAHTAIELEELRIQQVYETTSTVFSEELQALNMVHSSLHRDLKNLTLLPQTKQLYRTQLAELVGAEEGITIALSTAQHGPLKPLLLRKKNGEPLRQIKRNSLIRIHAYINKNQLLPLSFELIDWEKQEIDIPVFT